MTKEEQIEYKKTKPIEVGDYVLVQTKFIQENTVIISKGKNKGSVIEKVEQEFKTQGTVEGISDTSFVISSNSLRVPLCLKGVVDSIYEGKTQKIVVDKSIVFPTFLDCGVNPFSKEKRRINFYNQEIQSILYKFGYDRDKNSPTSSEWQKVNLDPYVYDVNNEKHYYQRGLVWTLEQKQLLIDSIYNDIEIGKFLFRYNSWKRMEREEAETGIMHSWDCVDGKQRINTILEFIENKFPDSNGNYWDGLSGNAQRRFMNFGNLSYGELPESATDEDVIDNFLTLNFTGVPMSREHIDFVRTIKISSK